jgi:anti-anti-sigma factor
MNITTTKEGKWTVILLSGRFDAQTATDVENEIRRILDNNKYIAVDLSEIQYMSSAGLRVLLSTLKLVKHQSGSMLLVSPKQNVLEVLELSGFAKIFMITESLKGLTE